eukprot:Lankesteria_metandrocarpae@DN4552_c0_g1_i1.p3
MMNNLLLKEGDIVRIVNTSLPKGTYVKLQPVTTDFLDVANPKAVLENALRHFATLTVGDNIVIQYNNKNFEIEIIEAEPNNAISVIETDVKVDFVEPKDYAAKQEKIADAAQDDVSDEAPDDTSTKTAASLFTGTGTRLDGKPLKAAGKQSSDAPQSRKGKRAHKVEKEEPRLPGGIRTVCEEYNRMKQRGLIAGVVGSANGAAQGFVPFDGGGNVLG